MKNPACRNRQAIPVNGDTIKSMNETPTQVRICPHCGSNAPIGATFCPNCTRRVLDFVQCPECLEPIARNAKFCPYCSQRVRRYQTGKKFELPPLDLSIRARRLGMLVRCHSPTGIIRPMLVHANHDRILILQWIALGFDSVSNEIPLSDIAKVIFKKGLFWSTIIIEPKFPEGMEQAVEPVRLTALPKRDARAFAHRLRAELERT